MLGLRAPGRGRLLVEVLAELNLVDRSIGVVGHGCYTQIITTADVEFLQCLHGRAPAVATGMKRMLPDRGDLHAPGRRRHGVGGPGRGAAHRGAGESITCLLLDNGVFGDTGGQMTATTTVGQRTKTDVADAPAASTLPHPGRRHRRHVPGRRLRRGGAVDHPNAVSRTRRYLREAFESQIRGEGFSLVEILTMCPTGWAVPTDEGAEYQRDQRRLSDPLGELSRTLTWTSASTTSSRARRRFHGAMRATLGDEQRTFADLEPAPTVPRTASPPTASRRGSGGVVGADRSRRARRLLRRHQARRRRALINPGFTEGEATTAIEYLRPRIVVVHPSYEEPARSIATALGLRVHRRHVARVARRCVERAAAPLSATPRIRRRSSSPAG